MTIPKLTRCTRTLSKLRTLAQHLNAYVCGTPVPSAIPAVINQPDEQRVTPLLQPEQQRVIAPLQRTTTAPPTIAANNPTGKRALRTTKRTHQRKTRANTTGVLPAIIHTKSTRPLPRFKAVLKMPLTFTSPQPPRPTPSHSTTRRSNRFNSAPVPGPLNVRFISQEAINLLVANNPITTLNAFVPLHL